MPDKAMFGIGEILVIAAFGWFVTRVLRRANRNQADTYNRPAPPLDPGAPVQRSRTEELGPSDRSSLAAASNPPAIKPPEPTRDEQMAELRRRYVADEISVEEYESELDR